MTKVNKLSDKHGLTEPVEYPSAEQIIPIVLNNMISEPEVCTQLIAGDRQTGVTYALVHVLKSYLSCITTPIFVGFITRSILSRDTRHFENDANYRINASTITHIPSGSTIKFIVGDYRSVIGTTYDLIFMDEVDYIQNRVTALMLTKMICKNVIIGATPSYGYVSNKEYTPDGDYPKYFKFDRVYRISPRTDESAIRAIQWELDSNHGTLAKEYPGLYRRILKEYIERHGS